MSFIDNLLPFRTAYLTGFVPVLAEGQQVGWTRSDFARIISDFNSTWELTSAGLELSKKLKTFDEKNQAVDETFVALSEAGILPLMPDYSAFGGIDWYPANAHDSGETLFIVKRFYAVFIGIRTHVVVMNGYTRDQYWAAIRSGNVDFGKGKLDVITAGAIRYGETVKEALIHEAWEEAGLNEQDLEPAVFLETMRLPNMTANGFFSDEYFYVFDIDLKDRVPVTNLPHEVAGFNKLTHQQLMEKVEDGNVFKEHINFVVTDFMIRHNILNETHTDFEKIKELLYRQAI